MFYHLTIGVLSPFVGGYYFGGLIQGIAQEAAAQGARVLAIQTLSSPQVDAQASQPATLTPGWDHLAGCIVINHALSSIYGGELVVAGKPIVAISVKPEGFACPYVRPDNRTGVMEAVRHLVAHGHHRIAYAGIFEQADFCERYDAYVDALHQAGIEPDPSLVYWAPDVETDVLDFRPGREVGERMLRDGLRSTAIVAGDDEHALGIMEALQAAGLVLPRDQALVGFDDIEAAAHREPALASVRQDFRAVGATAARLLLDKMAGLPVRDGNYDVDAVFVPRASCGCLRPADGRGPGCGTPATEPGRRLAERLDAGVAHAGSPAAKAAAMDRACRAILAAANAAIEGVSGPDEEQVREAVQALYRCDPRPDTLDAVTDAVSRFALELSDTRQVGPQAVARMASLVMWAFRAMTAAQSQHQFGQATYLRATLATQYEVARRLLGNGEEDPRALGWLAGTGVRAAQLALWSRPPLGNPDADRELEVVGTFGGPRRPAPLADGAPQDGPQPPARPLGEQGALSGPRQFPPADLLALADPGQGEVTMLLPVQLANRDWGLVAAVGPVDSEGTSGREGINQWASLLAVALERQEVIDSLANAYARERALSDEVRLGAERYALAAEAASGGLWDWDVAAGRVYYAPRWAAMLGWPESAITPSIHEWFDRVHPEDLGNLRSAIDAHASATKPELEIEHRIRHRDGTYKWVLCRALAVRGPDGAVRRIVGSLTNVDERKQLEERLRHDALYDALTGLPNRTLFAARVHQAVARSQTGATRHEFAVLFLDLDGFKLVNDSLGHVVGDALLAKVAERITSGIRPSDTASRFGGDEFAVLVDEIADGDDPVKVAKRVLAELAAPLFVDGYAIAVTASVGIASSDNRYETAEDVLRDADTAMYHAKAEGKNRYAIFDNRMHLRAVHQLRLEAELRPALGRRN